MSRNLASKEERPNEAGFTVVELLVSLTITGVLLMLTVSGISIVSKSWDRKSVAIEKTENISRMASLFRRDIANIRRIVIPRKKSLELLFTGDENSLTFVSIEPPFPTAGGPYFIEYSASAEGLKRSRAAYKRDQQEFPGASLQNQVQLLGPSFKTRFQYGKIENKTIVWLPNWPRKEELPEYIRLDLSDNNQTDPVTVSTLVASLNINAEQQCINARSQFCTVKGALLKKKKPGEQNQRPQTSGSGISQGGGNIPRPSP